MVSTNSVDVRSTFLVLTKIYMIKSAVPEILPELENFFRKPLKSLTPTVR
jgi:hypothetical protein